VIGGRTISDNSYAFKYKWQCKIAMNTLFIKTEMGFTVSNFQ